MTMRTDMFFSGWMPRSLHLQFRLILTALAVLITAGSLIAVNALHQSAAITRQLADERLVELEDAQKLAQLAQQVELETHRMLTTSSREQMLGSYASIVGRLDRLDSLVKRLGAANNDVAVLALHQAEQNFRNIVHIVAGLRGTELAADTGRVPAEGVERKGLQRFRDELEQQATAMVAATGKLSSRSSDDYRAAIRHLATTEDKTQRRVLTLLVGSLIVAWLISRIFLGKHVLARLHQVNRQLLRTEGGNEPARIPVEGEDEIGEMARAVERFLEDRRQLALTNQALQVSNDMLQAIFEAAPTAIFGLDLDGNVSSVWNGAAEKLLGWSAAEVIGQPYPAVPSAEEGNFRSILEQLKQGMTINGIEVRRIRRDGSPVDYSIYASPLHDAENRISGSIVVLVDITERKRMEEALHASETRLRDILSSTSDWIWELDANGRYTFCSEGILRVLGYQPDEVLGLTPFDMMPPEEQERVGSLFRQIVGRKAPLVDVENWNLTKDGRKVCVVTNGVPLLDDQGILRGYRGADRDMTAQKQLESQVRERTRELEVKNAELERLNKLFVGRELKMVELKERIKVLEKNLGD